MTDKMPIPPKRFAAMIDRLEAELADDEGHQVPREQVAEALVESVHTLVEAPVQDFVPLLAEHEARDRLRREGYHPNLDTDPHDTTPVLDERKAPTSDLWTPGGTPHASV
jgi:hypothetical protein